MIYGSEADKRRTFPQVSYRAAAHVTFSDRDSGTPFACGRRLGGHGILAELVVQGRFV